MGESITVNEATREQIRVCLISGGAGSLGRHLVDVLLQRGAVVRVLDNNEDGLYRIRERYIHTPHWKNIRLLDRDITDYWDCLRSIEGVDTVIHAAARKHVWLSEQNPKSALKVNVIGTQNMVDATLDNGGIQRFLFVSSDKAVNPTNLYGQSKAMGESLVLNAERVKGDKPTEFNVFRSGNFYASRGSVIEKWMAQIDGEEPLTVVKGGHRRFFISTYDAAKLCVTVCRLSGGGNIYIPKMKEYAIEDLAKLMSGNITWIDPLPGEKVCEELYTSVESERLRDLGEMWQISSH